MSRGAWNALATLCLIVGFALGVVPLVQWFLLDHGNGLVHRVFGVEEAPWVWGVPAVVLGAAVVGVLVFGTQGDRAGR